nr:G-type lectin S-receptor-like serine/threonine-protein kinase At2g19130 [Aegilops tauschii subsp. strangulata]
MVLWLLVISLHLHILQCHAATDTLSLSQELTGHDKLLSSNGRFALGFFQTGSKFSDNTPKWYLGIWFHTVPKFTSVWVANGENPIANLSSCKLVLSHDGNLVVLLEETTTAWSTKANTTTNTTVATLLDDGNLVLRSASNSSNVFWQSFDYPTDTILQGAKIGWNNSTGLIRRLVSRKNTIDQTTDMYSWELSGNNGGHTTIVSMFNPSQQYWSSGDWGGRYFGNIPETVGQTWLSLDFTSNEEGARVVRGITRLATIYTALKSQCDIYASCGPFTVCNDVPSPSCSCLKGYSIRSPQDWELDDRTGGCARNTPLYCSANITGVGKADKFYPMNSVQLPVDAKNVGIATTADECSLVCLGSCSSTAYSYDQGGCFIWHDKLLNIQQQGNNILHLCLAAKEEQSSNTNRRGLIIGVAIGASVAIVGLIFLWMLWMRKGRWYGDNVHGGMGIIAFRYADLQHAKNKFENKLGARSFGSVFKGSLTDSTTIAVKRLDGFRQGEKQFRAEVSSTGVIQHVNLVILIGFCCQGDKRLLVYEYMPNGSLDSHLFQSNGMVLDWTTRYQIALGIARGLSYLHSSCRACIIHCDIKPENILLDGSFTPKVADFGMAKLFRRDFSHVVTTMRETIRYLAPEWISGTPITSKVDVYSYGMVLLEIISGSRNSSKQSSYEDGVHEAYFPVRVARIVIATLVDAKLLGEVNQEEVERVCKVACWCIQDVEFDRPTMSEVVQFLKCVSEVETLPMPRLLQAIAGQPNSKIM